MRKLRWRFLKQKFRKIFVWVTIMFLVFVAVVLGIFIYLAKDLPSPDAVAKRAVAQSTKIYDRTGEVLLFDLFGEEKRTVIRIEDIPQHTINATIAAEDKNFYNHIGIDVKAIMRAALRNIREGELIGHGASTITQQLVKNTILTKERTFARKIKEALLAIELDFRYSKEEILGMYFNQISYGSTVYGIEAASNVFFGKQAKDLSIAQSAVLAALTKATTYYSPYGPNVDALLERKNAVINQMSDLGFITQEQAQEAKKETIIFARNIQNIRAPHFVFYVRDYLNRKYDENFINRAGWKVITTLDWSLQEKAEVIINEGAKNNDNLYGAANAALLALDPKTGQILSMVGSRSYFEEPLPPGCVAGLNCKFEPNVNVTTRERSPGSAIKPIIYATAFKKGFSDKTVVYDVPTEFNPLCQPDGTPPPQYANEEKFCYRPGNYDGTYHGLVSLRESLARSLNIPAVKTMYLAGIEDSIRTAEDFGITTLKDRSRFGLSLVLGGAEVKPIELVSAYGAFAQDGVLHETTPILKIIDSNGNIIEEFSDKSRRSIDEQVARLITNILSDNDARTPVFGHQGPLYFPNRQVAAKTGTAQDYKDAWVVGYTPSLAVGVWVGNNDNRPMTRQGAGISAAGPLWHSFMEYALASSSPEEFIKPDQISYPQRPMLGGMLDGGDPGALRHSILFHVDKTNPLGPPPQNPQNDPQFTHWEYAVQTWLLGQPQTPHQNKNPSILIFSPLNQQQILGEFIDIKTSVIAQNAITQVDFFIDGIPVGSDTLAPYELLYRIPVSFSLGAHSVTVRAYDALGNQGESTIVVTKL